MRKSESIVKLQELGLNTLDYFITENKAEVIHYLARHADEKMSLRTERGDQYDCPFYYMTKGESLLAIALKHLSEGYKLILAPSLDIKGCLAFGVVAFGANKGDCAEFVEGEGKVREVYTHPDNQSVMIDRVSLVPVTVKEVGKRMAPILNSIYRELKEVCWDEVPCCIEWSYYSQAVGVKKQSLIVWELRPYA